MDLNLRCNHEHSKGVKTTHVDMCGKIAVYGWGVPTRCLFHVADHMDICVNVRCSAAGCNAFPIYGKAERQPVRCLAHKLEGDVKCKAGHCSYPGCGNVEFIGNDYCVLHRGFAQNKSTQLHTIDGKIHCCTEIGCTINAMYGFYNTDKIFCVFHCALDRNIYATSENIRKCTECIKRATQYSDRSVLLKNPYAVPDLCVDCLLATKTGSTNLMQYHNCATCGCYTVMFVGNMCASCCVASTTDAAEANDIREAILRPISARFIMRRQQTGEYICTIRSRVCKDGARNVFKLPPYGVKSQLSKPTTNYTKFTLSADTRTPVRNRFIRIKMFSYEPDTLMIMNENKAQDGDNTKAEREFLQGFIANTFTKFKYQRFEPETAGKMF